MLTRFLNFRRWTWPDPRPRDSNGLQLISLLAVDSAQFQCLYFSILSPTHHQAGFGDPSNTYVSSVNAIPKYSFSFRLKWEATRSRSSLAKSLGCGKNIKEEKKVRRHDLPRNSPTQVSTGRLAECCEAQGQQRRWFLWVDTEDITEQTARDRSLGAWDPRAVLLPGNFVLSINSIRSLGRTVKSWASLSLYFILNWQEDVFWYTQHTLQNRWSQT